MKTTPTLELENDQHPSGFSVFSRLIILAAAMMALSYGIIMATVATAKWLS